MSTGPALTIGEIAGERRLVALGPDRVTVECTRCGTVETTHRNMFRRRPGPCSKCRRADIKARAASRIIEAIPEVDGCPVVATDGRVLTLLCPCGSEYTLLIETVRTGQHHTPHRCSACRKARSAAKAAAKYRASR